MYLTQFLINYRIARGGGRIVSAGKDAIAKVRIASCPMGKCSENSLSFFYFFFVFVFWGLSFYVVVCMVVLGPCL